MLSFFRDLQNSKQRSYAILLVSVVFSIILAYFGFVTQQNTIDSLELRLAESQNKIALGVDESRRQLPLLKHEINEFFQLLNKKLDSSIVYYDMVSSQEFQCKGFEFWKITLLGLEDSRVELLKVLNTEVKTREEFEQTCGFASQDFVAETTKHNFWYLSFCESGLCDKLF